MASDPQRIERLATAGSFCLFDKRLSSSGTSSIVWGLINLLIGTAVIAQNNSWGAVSLVLGLALVAAGIYERRVREPKVIIISAATLGVLALWNFMLIALAAMGKMQLVLGGRTLFWAVIQAWAAYTTWKTYSSYKTLLEKSDPLTVQHVRECVDELKKAKPEQSSDLIEFEVNSGFLSSTKRYRLKTNRRFISGGSVSDPVQFVAFGRRKFRAAQRGDAHFGGRKMDEQEDQGHRPIGPVETGQGNDHSGDGLAN